MSKTATAIAIQGDERAALIEKLREKVEEAGELNTESTAAAARYKKAREEVAALMLKLDYPADTPFEASTYQAELQTGKERFIDPRRLRQNRAVDADTFYACVAVQLAKAEKVLPGAIFDALVEEEDKQTLKIKKRKEVGAK